MEIYLDSSTLFLIVSASKYQPYQTQHILDLLRPFFPDLLEGVTCSKMGLQLSFRKNLQFMTHCWCLSHLVPEIQLFEKSFFLTFRCSEATLAPLVRVPPYENKAFLTNSVIPRPNGKLFDHEKWFLTYLTYIQEYTKIIRISTH